MCHDMSIQTLMQYVPISTYPLVLTRFQLTTADLPSLLDGSVPTHIDEPAFRVFVERLWMISEIYQYTRTVNPFIRDQLYQEMNFQEGQGVSWSDFLIHHPDDFAIKALFLTTQCQKRLKEKENAKPQVSTTRGYTRPY